MLLSDLQCWSLLSTNNKNWLSIKWKCSAITRLRCPHVCHHSKIRHTIHLLVSTLFGSTTHFSITVSIVCQHLNTSMRFRNSLPSFEHLHVLTGLRSPTINSATDYVSFLALVEL